MDQEFPVGSRVKNRNTGIEGVVKAMFPGARRRIEWDDDRTTLTHIGDLVELVD